MQPNAFGTIGGILRLLAAGLLLCGLAARAETFYANGDGTKTAYAYDWYNKDNWQVMDAASNLVAATSAPQQGDTVIFNKAIYYMSAYPDGAIHPGLHKVEFNVNNTIHQGFVSLQAGGESAQEQPRGKKAQVSPNHPKCVWLHVAWPFRLSF